MPRDELANPLPVIASEAKQPRGRMMRPLGCFVASLLAMTIGAQLFTAPAAAKRFPIPGDRPGATVDIPDSWSPAVAAEGVEGLGLEGAVVLTVEFVSAPDAEAAGAAALIRLAQRGVVVAPETKRTARRSFNGSDAFKIDFSGAGPNGDTDVTLIMIASPRKPGFVSICYWGDDEALESVSNDIQSIADSVEFVK
jgi:hypothetical protein